MDLRDVVIYEIATKKIDTIAGKAMEYDGPRECVSRRLATVLPRLNDRYDACSVPSGKYEKGDVIDKDDLFEDWSDSKRIFREQE